MLSRTAPKYIVAGISSLLLLGMAMPAYSQSREKQKVLKMVPMKLKKQVTKPAQPNAMTDIATMQKEALKVKRVIESCIPRSVEVTQLSYTIRCFHSYPSENGEYFLNWVIRRDHTQPSWALKPDSFSELLAILMSKETALTSRFVGKGWIFQSMINGQPPAKYCAQQLGHVKTKCFELETYQFGIKTSGN